MFTFAELFVFIAFIAIADNAMLTIFSRLLL